MILHVTYETDKGIIKRTLKHRYQHVLLESARNCKEYRDSHTVTYDFEEVNEDGDKCCEFKEVGMVMA